MAETVFPQDPGDGRRAIVPFDAADVTEEDLAVLREVRQLRAAGGRRTKPALQQALMAAGLDLVEPATVAQARRNAQVRNTLLSTPCYSYETLHEVRGDTSVATTRAAVQRARSAGRLVTVTIDGRVVIPAFQLTDQGQPRPELAALIEPLVAAGLSAWGIWTWLVHPTGLISGLIPHEAAHDPSTAARARRAAERHAAHVRGPVAG